MPEKEITLLEPTEILQEAFLTMAAEFWNAGEYYGHHETAQRDFGTFLDELRDMQAGKNLPKGFVPMSTFWMVRASETILGESRLRHWLNPALEIEGGHIGYAIRPAVRGRGYGTLILALTLEKARSKGLGRALVTCDTDNLASARVIEKNGGALSGMALSLRSGKQVSQYWIAL